MLYTELPLLVIRNISGLSDNFGEILSGIDVHTFLTVFLYPSQCLLIFFMVIDFQINSAKNLCHIYPLCSHSQILLKEVYIYHTTCDTHGYRTDVHIGLVLHNAYCNRSSGKIQNLLLHIFCNAGFVLVLYFGSIDGEGRKTSLCVSCHNCCQIYSSRSFCSVKAPNRLDGIGIQVHSLRSVAPAGSNRQGSHYIFLGKILLADSSFSTAANGCGRNHHLHRLSVRITKIL